MSVYVTCIKVNYAFLRLNISFKLIEINDIIKKQINWFNELIDKWSLSNYIC